MFWAMHWHRGLPAPRSTAPVPSRAKAEQIFDNASAVKIILNPRGTRGEPHIFPIDNMSKFIAKTLQKSFYLLKTRSIVAPDFNNEVRLVFLKDFFCAFQYFRFRSFHIDLHQAHRLGKP